MKKLDSCNVNFHPKTECKIEIIREERPYVNEGGPFTSITIGDYPGELRLFLHDVALKSLTIALVKYCHEHGVITWEVGEAIDINPDLVHGNPVP